MMMKTAKLKIGKDGYVKDIRCSKGHSGNTRYVRDGGYCQCQGCGHFITVEFAISEQAALAAAK